MINNELSEYHLVKYIIIGEAGVGKTSLAKYYVDREKANYKYMSTIGVSLFHVDKIINEKNVRLHIWDTAGQERFNSIVQCYYREAHGAFICFALNRRYTFDKVENHINDIINYNDDKIIEYILVGTHLDKTSERKVEKEEAQKLAKKYNMKYIEISSKTGENVDKCFDIMNDLMSEHVDNMDENMSHPIIKYGNKSKYCCMK